MSKMMISVYCLAYNHEKYIKDALEGFVNQKTGYEFEVFVHDDASTDGTVAIIAEYAEKYPQIIKPIYQKENQYSKGIKVAGKYIFPQMTGKYIAVCEGDDYWCDDMKLEKQVKYLEEHPECSACVHNTLRINCLNGKTSFFNQSSSDTDISAEQIFEMEGSLFHISSVLYRKEYLYRPVVFYAKSFGDYPLAIYLGVNGKIHYFKEVMSVYRLWSEGSWTSRNYLSNNADEYIVKIKREKIRLLEDVDEYTEGKYHEKISEIIRFQKYEIEGALGNYRTQMTEYQDVFEKQAFRKKMKVFFERYIPCTKKIKIILKRKRSNK